MSQQAPVDDKILDTDKGALVLRQTMASDFLISLFKFFRLKETHSEQNEIFDRAGQELFQTALAWMNAIKKEGLDLRLVGEQIFINDVRIRPRTRVIKKIKYILKTLRSRQVIGFEMPKLNEATEISSFASIVHSVKPGSKAGEVTEKLKEQGLGHFTISNIAWGDAEADSEQETVLDQITKTLRSFITDVFTTFEESCKLESGPNLQQILYELNSVSEADLITYFCKTGRQQQDNHLVEVAINTCLLLHSWAKSLGLPTGVVSEIAEIGLAHPLAKINQKKGERFDPLSFNRTALLYSNLRAINKLWRFNDLQRLALLEFPIPFGNNGTYQHGQHRCYQHFFSRMLRIALLFQQMTTFDRRREQMTSEQAVQKLLTTNLGCDPSLTKLFVSWLGIHPVGTFVKLNSGELGQICSTAMEPAESARPKVSVFTNADGSKCAEPRIIDLKDTNDKSGMFKNAISETLDPNSLELDDKYYEQLNSALVIATTF